MTADPRVRSFVNPVRVTWDAAPAPQGAERLLDNPLGQATMWRPATCVLGRGVDGRSDSPPLVCDFGRELHSGVQFIVRNTIGNKPARVRVTFGESLAEALGTPNPDHAIHQVVTDLPWAGQHEIGNTGFRFVRVDLPDDDTLLELHNLRAVTLMLPAERVGAFECSDARINDVWRVGADTVHLCMQDHIWDGIKRDRLVWWAICTRR